MIYFDIETLDLFTDYPIRTLPKERRLAALRFGLAVTYDSDRDEWREWFAADLPALWRYLSGHELCGWNIRYFDIPVIHHNLAQHHGYPNAVLSPQHVVEDLFDNIRHTTDRWYKLEVVAQANLNGRGKIADGLQAVEWLRSGDPALARRAAEYCRDDVELVVELHKLLMAGEGLKLPARPERGEAGEAFYFLRE